MARILILYATAGAGHKKAAEAIERAAEARGLDIEMADIARFMSGPTRRFYSDGYLFLISRLPWLWAILYSLSDTPVLKIINVSLRRFINAILCRRLIAYLLQTKPETVISTQFLTSEVVSYTKIKHNLPTRLITVITDFGVHNFWINPRTDMYCCASETSKQILLQKGVPERQIAVTGIPLDEKFTRPLTRPEVNEEFRLQNNTFTALIVTGGIGVGPIETIVDLLKDDVQLLVVCGSNKKLYGSLSQKNYKNVHVFEFVDFMQKLMRACDVIVTKAGGLTVTEGLAMELPMVFFFLIPGQESINAATVAREEAGFIARSPFEIKQLVLALKNNPESLASRRAKAKAMAKPDSCQKILSLVNP